MTALLVHPDCVPSAHSLFMIAAGAREASDHHDACSQANSGARRRVILEADIVALETDLTAVEKYPLQTPGKAVRIWSPEGKALSRQDFRTVWCVGQSGASSSQG